MGVSRMTVAELHERLTKWIDAGHGNTDVIAKCYFTLDGTDYEKHFIYLTDVYYQSGDIELSFSNTEQEE